MLPNQGPPADLPITSLASEIFLSVNKPRAQKSHVLLKWITRQMIDN
jgi:hypothetical protein